MLRSTRCLVAWRARRLRQRRTIVGGHGEAERSERGGGGGWGAEGRSEPFQGSHIKDDAVVCLANILKIFAKRGD